MAPNVVNVTQSKPTKVTDAKKPVPAAAKPAVTQSKPTKVTDAQKPVPAAATPPDTQSKPTKLTDAKKPVPAAAKPAVLASATKAVMPLGEAGKQASVSSIATVTKRVAAAL